MNNRQIRILIMAAATMVSVQSCIVAKKYQQPPVAELDERLFRTDELPQDSSTLADISWRSFFQDELLESYIDTALANNVDIRVALKQIDVANQYFLQGRLGYLPSLSVAGQVQHQELSNNSQFGQIFNGSITQYDITATLGWEADIWGKIRSTKRAAEASFLQSVEAHKAVKTSLVANVATIYYQLMALDAQLEVLTETVANRESSLETTKALKTAGNLTEVAVQQTEAQLLNARGQALDIKRQIVLAENGLCILLGIPPRQLPRSQLSDISIPQDLKTGFPAQLLSNRPDVAAAELGFRNAFELTNVARANFYPSLKLTASGGVQSLDLGDLLDVNSLYANILGGITQPIFNRRQIKTQFEVAQAQQEIAFEQFRGSLLTAGRDVSNALANYESFDSQIEIKEQEVNAYTLATDYSEKLLDNGLANYLEVLTARENMLGARISLTTMNYNRLGAVVALYRSLGGGWR